MGILLDTIFSPSASDGQNRGPTDDFWYAPAGMESATGIRVTAEVALKASTALACVRYLADTVGSLPCLIIEKKEVRGRTHRVRATNHPIFDVLRRQPNPWQTAMEFWRMAVAFHALWGNFYAEIRPGPRGFADTLWPIYPAEIKVEQLPTGRLVYQRTDPKTGARTPYAQEQIFHLRGLSLDGLLGMDIVTVARDVLGLALATQAYAAHYFRNYARPLGFLYSEGKVEPEEAQRMLASWKTANAGVNQHSTALLSGGVKFEKLSPTNNEAQFLETKKQQALEICQVFRVPPHKVGILDHANYNKVEEQGIDVVTDTIRPIVTLFAQRIDADLILDTRRFHSMFLLEDLMRGDSAARSAFYNAGILGGWMNRNEVREREDLDPADGLDEFLEPVAIAKRSTDTPGQGDPKAEMSAAEGGPNKLEALLLATAGRLVRKEIQAATKAAQRAADDPEGFPAKLQKFYAAHGEQIASELMLPTDVAESYCAARRTALVAQGAALLESWQAQGAEPLAALARETHQPDTTEGETHAA